MKHFKYIILLLLPILIFGQSGCLLSKPVPLEDVDSALIERITEDGTEQIAVIYSGDEALEAIYNIFYATYLDDAAKPSENLVFRLTLEHGRGSDIVPLIFDLEKNNAFVFREDHYYRLPDGTIKTWLENYPQRDLLTIKELPEVPFAFNGKSFEPAMDAIWHETVYPEVMYLSDQVALDEPALDTVTFENVLKANLGNFNAPDAEVMVYRGNALFMSGEPAEDGTLPMPEENGSFRYVVKVDNTSDLYTSNAVYTFSLNINVPASYWMGRTEAVAGDAIAFQILQPDADAVYEAHSSLKDDKITLYPYGDSLIGITPIDSRTTAGTYELAIKDANLPGEPLQTFTFTVSDLDSPRQNLRFSSSTGAVATEENYDYDNAKLAEAFSYTNPAPLWEGVFLQPVEGRITTDYATRRYYNNSTTEDARHNALDIAADEGTPIAAANTGKIVLAEELKVSGNAVIIDHGMGIYTSYFHLSSIDVTKGDTVEKGETIGKVGSTGFSTGAHLHWSIYKDGVYINPWQLIAADPLEGIR